MNGFTYDESKKVIEIRDGSHIVIWKYVEPNVAEQAGKMFHESKNIDTFLHQNNCRRSWGQGVPKDI